MAKKELLTFEKAQAELHEILNELQHDQVNLDQLTNKIKRAKELILFCRDELRNTKTELETLLDFDLESE